MSKALESSPNPAQAEVQVLIALLGAGKQADAVAFGKTLASRYPRSLLLCQVLGATHVELKQHEQAAGWFEQAVRLDPGSAEARFNLGVAMQELDRKDEAIDCYQQVIRIRPGYAEAHHNLGSQLHDLGRRAEAVACYRRAIGLKPDYAEAYYNLGLVFHASGQRPEAISEFRKALAIKPDHAGAMIYLGSAMQALGRLEDALACLDRALGIEPDHAMANCQRLHLHAHMCNWDALAAVAATIPDMGMTGEAVTPFVLLSLEDHPGRHRIRSESFGEGYARNAVPADIARPSARSERLRIGYFSADFYNHATMYLISRLFELHDRHRFSVHVFSYGPARDDEMRRRLKRSVDGFHDIAALSDMEAAELARREGIDIAVDLKGYTQDTRLGIFAWRPAPVQISYLGYPGTLGVPFIDYIIADKTVIPESRRQDYAEKIIYLPDSYQVNDNRRAISDHLPNRAETGLPDQGFVFCCFNNSYKISPAEFDIWMRLLHRVEGSVLWLFEANRQVEANLRREAEKRGVGADRLLFARRLPQAEHLARQALADLFLDTFNVNAHTTASDALWAGLPVLTKIGNGFAARVAASLLLAIGLPELITETADDYERLALELATAPDRLAAYRARLATNRASSPLFDTARFVGKIEAGYQEAYRCWFEGSDPEDIVIA